MARGKSGPIAIDLGATGQVNGNPDDNTGTAKPDSFVFDDPAAAVTAPAETPGDASGETPRRRGRPKGSKNRGTQAPAGHTPLDIDGVSAILLNAHNMLFLLTQVPEFKMEE